MKTPFASIALALALICVGCSPKAEETPKPETKTASEKPSQPSGNKHNGATRFTKLATEVMTPGTGTAVTGKGDTLNVSYKGTLVDGTEFDGNVGKAEPLPVVLGANSVIKGWEDGLIGMKKGEKRKLKIPAELGYGSSGSGKIPPDSDLLFEVTCLDFVKKGEEEIFDRNDVKVGSGATAEKGKKVTVTYKGTYATGKEFDHGSFTFTIGKAEVVPGFDAGVTGMKVGGERTVRIPPVLGYGTMGGNGIPPNAILNFSLRLDKVE